MNLTSSLKRRSLLQAAAGSLVLPGAVFAQDNWPSRAVRVIVPSSPGGGTDVFGRIISQALGDQLKQSFVVDNKPGASGNIGATIAAQADPDGYTLLVASNSSLAINPVLLKTMPFDIEKDLVPVARGVFAPMVIVANPATGWKTMKDMIDAGKKEPEKYFYGTAGVGSPLYMGVRMLEDTTGARFTHVPYKGVAPAYQDLLSGRLNFMWTDLASIEQHIKSGKVVALGINQKSPLLPNVPALADVGIKTDASTSFSVMAPAKTPPAIIKRLSAEVNKAFDDPAVKQRLAQVALNPVHDTPEKFAAELRKERQHWGDFIKRKNIQPD
jgi:tripartite-type tricarboxylate transporter receptor subunit TctC